MVINIWNVASETSHLTLTDLYLCWNPAWRWGGRGERSGWRQCGGTTPGVVRVQSHWWPARVAAGTAAGSPPHSEGSLNTEKHTHKQDVIIYTYVVQKLRVQQWTTTRRANTPASRECLLLRSWMCRWCPHRVCKRSWRCRTLPLSHAYWWY